MIHHIYNNFYQKSSHEEYSHFMNLDIDEIELI